MANNERARERIGAPKRWSPAPPYRQQACKHPCDDLGGRVGQQRACPMGSKLGFSPCVHAVRRGDALDTPSGRADRWFWARHPPNTTPSRQVTPSPAWPPPLSVDFCPLTALATRPNIHTYIHTYIHTHTYVRTYVRTYIHTYTHTHIHAYIHASHACMYAYMHSCIHPFIQTLQT